MSESINQNSCTSAIWELGKCQKAFNEQQEKYNKLLAFVKELQNCNRLSQDDYSDFHDVSISAKALLIEIGESK